MLKKITTFLLALLLAPFLAIAAAVATIFLLAIFAPVYPIAIVGLSIIGSGAIGSKLANLFSKETSKTNLVLTFSFGTILFIPGLIPSALIIALTAVVITPLLFLALSCIFPYYASTFLTDKISSIFEPEFIINDDGVNLLSPESSNIQEDPFEFVTQSFVQRIAVFRTDSKNETFPDESLSDDDNLSFNC